MELLEARDAAQNWFFFSGECWLRIALAPIVVHANAGLDWMPCQLVYMWTVYWCVCDCCQMIECSEVERQKGLVIPCMISYIDKVSNDRCREMLERVEPLVFSDYHLIYNFVKYCDEDISRLHCGRTDRDDDRDKVKHTLGDIIFSFSFSFTPSFKTKIPLKTSLACRSKVMVQIRFEPVLKRKFI